MKRLTTNNYKSYKSTDVFFPSNTSYGMVESISPNNKLTVHLAGRDNESNIGFQVTTHPNKFFNDFIVPLNKNYAIVQTFDEPLIKCYERIDNIALNNIVKENSRILLLSINHRINSTIELYNKICNGRYIQVINNNIVNNYDHFKNKHNINEENIIQENINCNINIDLLNKISHDENFLNSLYKTSIDESLKNELKNEYEFYYKAYEKIDDIYVKKPMKIIMIKIETFIK